MDGRVLASGPYRVCGSPSASLPSYRGGPSVSVEARGVSDGAVAVRLEPTLDGALGVDAIEPDPNRRELPALGRAPDRLRVQPQQLGQLTGLVVPLDHRRLISRVRLEGKGTTNRETSETRIIA